MRSGLLFTESVNSLHNNQADNTQYNGLLAENKTLSKFDLSIFKTTSIDSNAICEHITSLTDYMNLTEIINECISDESISDKLVYK